MHIPVTQVTDSVAGRLEGLPLMLPGLTGETQAKIIISCFLVVFLIFGRRLLLRVVDRRVGDQASRYRWAKASSYVATLTGVLFIAQIWFTALRSVGTFLGLLSAGLAIALKDLVADLAGWIFIIWRRPFDPGDRVQIGQHAGDVVDTRIFAFTIMEIGNWVNGEQSTGRMIHIPNSRVFSEPLANYTAGFPFLWNELPVLVTFESDWRKAKGILQGIADDEAMETSLEAERVLRERSRRFLIRYRKLTPVIYTSVLDSGVLLTLRYLTHPRARRGSAEVIWERILDAFHDEPSIDFAYPTQRLYFNPMEGKPDVRADLPPLGS